MLTGAGCSTGSGIPDYRDADGQWKRKPPVNFQAFMGEAATRQRYWARSLIGWRRMRDARPNGAHRALARLEELDKCEMLLTQNVDRLHQAAGSRNVVDLHGRIDRLRCMGCGRYSPRDAFQLELARLNPDWLDKDAPEAPDGDADLEGADFSAFVVPSCEICGGVLKPDVVFFGESVPRERVEAAAQYGEGLNHWLNLTVRATRPAQVRHWLAARGIIVSRLIRVRYGPFMLDDLPRGMAVPIRQADVENFRGTLKKAAV